MLKKIILILFLIYQQTNYLKADGDNLKNKNTINWVENIPIFPDLKINKKNTVEFDSVSGKILIVQFSASDRDLLEIKNFYNNFFSSSNWVAKSNSKFFLEWEKSLSKFTKRRFLIKKYSHNEWSLKFVVENF